VSRKQQKKHKKEITGLDAWGFITPCLRKGSDVKLYVGGKKSEEVGVSVEGAGCARGKSQITLYLSFLKFNFPSKIGPFSSSLSLALAQVHTVSNNFEGLPLPARYKTSQAFKPSPNKY